MIIKKVTTVLLVPVLFIAISCYSPPEFPVEPSISFKSIIFKELDNLPDSLILSLEFKDGDGDLGLGTNELGEPYHDIWFFRKADNTLLTYSDRFTPPYDTLPPYEFPYTCLNYSTNRGIEGYENDTLYFQQNENHWNIFVEYFVKKNGVYTEFDWEIAFPPQCSDSFNGRFPVMTDLSNSPLEGVLRYGMTSSGFKILFRNDTLKLRVRIKDRALHTSNVFETPDFVLKNIKID